MKALALALLFVLTGFDQVRGVLGGIEAWRAMAAYDRCVAEAGPQGEWMCE